MKRVRSRLGLLLVLGMLTAILPVGSITAASAAPAPIAYDMVGSASLNLISESNTAPVFTSLGDGFQKFQRGVTADIPFALMDDSLVTFPSDTSGIIDDNNLDEFFGVVDTENGNNSGAVSASWVFDVAGSINLSAAINMGAMGDFETTDSFVWTASLDGGTAETIITSSVDEAATLSYTLAGGAVVALDDPLAMNGTTLNNLLQTVTAPISGTGNELTLTLTVLADGGSEGYAVQDIVISGEAAPANVYISELHYDNTGSDTGEFVEVSGTAGADLTGWSIVFYNGSNGTSYGTLPLTGTIDDENGSEGAVDFLFSGIQNGSPDGLALVNPLGEVVEFLSYEGTLTASGGPADGLTSTDIGVSEPSSTPVGESLQLSNGLWSGPLAASQGDLNPDIPPPVATVNISEIHYDNTGADVDESVEVTGTAGGDLAGWSIVFYNGSNGTSYGTLSLTGIIDNEDGALGAVNFLFSGIQNGSPDGLALVNPLGEVVEFLSYEGTLTASGGPADGLTSTDIGVSEPGSTPVGESLQLFDGTWSGPRTASPGVLNEAPPVGVTPAFIHEVQGNGAATPFDGQRVLVQGVVTADHQDGDFNGWFMQDTDANADADPTTSNGIFVFEGGNMVDVAVGDIVQLEGDAGEFFDMTQLDNISDVTVLSSGNTFSAATVSLPWASLDEAEQYEGMYVTVPQDLTISEYFNFDRFGEIVLTVGRPAQPTAAFDPGSPEAAALAITNQLGRITLDDNRTSQNPDPAIHPNGAEFTLDNLFRGGDTVANVTGVINYSFGLYRIQPTQGADYTAVNPRTATPDDVGGTLKVASFNVLNYFTTFGSRGADNQEEFDRQRDKIITAISTIDADIVGLMEIENNDAAIIDLVDGLNAANGAGTYDYVDTGVIGDDAIKVAFIYKPAMVDLNGAYEILDSSVDPLFDDTKNRPALAQTFTELANGESVTVVVNHLKSKGSECGPGDDDPEAGSCNLTRTNAATALVNWLAGPGFDDDVLVIGDLNSYDKEDPIDALKAGGYTDLIFDFLGEDAYSYVFSGQWGYLDYAMANAAVAESVTGTTVWHINADEADLIDYDTSFKQDAQDALYAPDAYRSSDHDPVIVGLDLTPPDVTGPEVHAAFDTIYAGYYTGYYTVDFSCTDDVDPDPSCDATINGIEVEDGQRVFLIKSRWGRPWHRQIGRTLYIKDSSFELSVVSIDEAGNETTETAEPEFRTWRKHRKSI